MKIMNYVIVDVESDGPIPGKYSMVNFGAVAIKNKEIIDTFLSGVKPISEEWIEEALAISGVSREEHLSFPEPNVTMSNFQQWIDINYGKSKVTFVSDNPAFDRQWINYYFHSYLGNNPFGHSARRIGDLYSGLKKEMGANNERKRLLRKTVHDHNPLNDALGNAKHF